MEPEAEFYDAFENLEETKTTADLSTDEPEINSENQTTIATRKTQFNLKIIEPSEIHDLPRLIEALLRFLSTETKHECRAVSLDQYSFITQNGVSILLLALDFSSPSDEFEESLAASFCRAFMHPAANHHLQTLTSNGLLGLSALQDSDLARTWKMVVLETIYVHGAEVMGDPQKNALGWSRHDLVPDWMKVVSFLMDTDIETAFSASPVMGDADDDYMNAARQRRVLEFESVKAYVRQPSMTLAIDLMTRIAKERNEKSERQQQVTVIKSAMRPMFNRLRVLDKVVKDTIESHNISRQRQAEIFAILFDFTVCAFDAFTVTEELIQIFQKWIWTHSLHAAANTGVGLFASGNAMMSYTAGATGRMLASGTLAAASMFTAGYNVYSVIKTKSRKDFANASLHLVWQAWKTASEIITMLRWVNNSGGTFEFVDDHQRDWEEHLKVRLGNLVEDEWKSTEYLCRYLDERYEDLAATRTELEDSLVKVYS